MLEGILSRQTLPVDYLAYEIKRRQLFRSFWDSRVFLLCIFFFLVCARYYQAAEGQEAPGIDLVIESGDALLFRGHAVFHAVDGFADVEDGKTERSRDEAVPLGSLSSSAGSSVGSAARFDSPANVRASPLKTTNAAPPPEDWAERLQSAAKGRAEGGWEPARLALLFRDEEDAR